MESSINATCMMDSEIGLAEPEYRKYRCYQLKQLQNCKNKTEKIQLCFSLILNECSEIFREEISEKTK